jgi:hypothetical protein
MKRINMAFVLMTVTISATLFLSAGRRKTVHETSNDTEKAGRAPIPLILQENEGDHLVHRAGPLGGVPFIIKVDGQFGNSEDFFVFAETLAGGQTIARPAALITVLGGVACDRNSEAIINRDLQLQFASNRR